MGGLDRYELVEGHLLAGRGGGSGSIFQGKAGSLERRQEAVDGLRQALTGER